MALAQGTLASGSISGNSTNSALSPSSQKILITSNMTQAIGTLNSFGGVVSENTFVPVGLAVPYIAGATGATSKIANGEMVYLDLQTKKVWDLSNLTSFVKGYYYKPSQTGPSFLDRLEGRLNLSSRYPIGMETMLNLQEMSSSGLQVNYGYSCVDYMYFSNTTGSSIRNGNYDPIFSWLKIDSASKNSYDLGELA
jgi:phosphohistidine swiveling domain-containing protein